MPLAPLSMQVQSLVSRLLADEQYGLAVYVAKRWQLDARRIWEQWATALIACAPQRLRLEHCITGNPVSKKVYQEVFKCARRHARSESWSVGRLGMYKEADSRLANAFRTPASQAAASREHDAEDTALAVRFVHQLEATAPLNIDGLQALVHRRQQMVLREAEISLDAADYLQVSPCWAQLDCLVESQTTDAPSLQSPAVD